MQCWDGVPSYKKLGPAKNIVKQDPEKAYDRKSKK